jgi:hypothetical protein
MLDDKPGALADLAETLGEAGINIIGACGLTVGGKGEMHVLIDDVAKARLTLMEKGIAAGEDREVLVLSFAPKAGELGHKARALAKAGVNLNLVYLTEDRRMVLGVDNLERAKAAL